MLKFAHEPKEIDVEPRSLGTRLRITRAYRPTALVGLRGSSSGLRTPGDPPGRRPPHDAVEPELIDQASTAIRSFEGIEHIRELRIRWIGHILRADVDVEVDPQLSVAAAHDLVHHAEDHPLAYLPRLTAATIHVSPTGAHSG